MKNNYYSILAAMIVGLLTPACYSMAPHPPKGGTTARSESSGGHYGNLGTPIREFSEKSDALRVKKIDLSNAEIALAQKKIELSDEEFNKQMQSLQLQKNELKEKMNQLLNEYKFIIEKDEYAPLKNDYELFKSTVNFYN